MQPWDAIASAISEATEQAFSIAHKEAINGGCINNAYRLSNQHGLQFFVKTNPATHDNAFYSEADGLKEIEKSQSIKVPKVILHGQTADYTFLVLEHLDLRPNTPHSAQQLGQKLAQMHKQPQSYFGWQQDNHIGSTRQRNKKHQNWISFWREQRLGVQLQLAAKNGYAAVLQAKGIQLLDRLAYFFDNYQPTPSLLHGDLWSGNYSTTKEGEAVVFDPAVYYGDRETDLAMTELFGGFAADFYHSYNANYPVDSGYEERKTLYNFYHILNHLNLFGRGYLSQAESMLDHLLQRCR